MANIINLPTYEQVDGITQGITNINNTLDKGFEPFIMEGLVSATTEFTTALEITGEGFLTKAMIHSGIVRVTIDHKIIYLGGFVGNSYGAGICQDSQITSDLKVLISDQMRSIKRSITPNYLIETNEFSRVYPTDIPFKSNLKIELKKTLAGNVTCDIMGGMLL